MSDINEKISEPSWIDPISNKFMLSGFDVLGYLRWLNHRKAKVNQILPDFLHEYTHHWCFDSRVGTSLALLQMRAAQAAFLTSFGFADDAQQATKDAVRVRAAFKLLAPLAEGLAQFAEFDVGLGAGDYGLGLGDYLSPPLTAALYCFGFALGGDDAAKYSLLGMLQTMRRDREFCERKAGRFARPISGVDPYLGGYLAVKNLHAVAMQKCELFMNTDVFLGFIRSWFYDDPGLVSELLNNSQPELDAVTAISKHLTGRISQFLECDLNAEATLWLAGIARTEDKSFRADDQIACILREHERYQDEPDNFVRNVVGLKSLLIQHREYVVLGRVCARASPEPGGEVSFSPVDFPSLCMVGVDTALQEVQEGSILVVWDASDPTLAIFGVLGERAVTLGPMFGAPTADKIERLTMFASSHEALLRPTQMLDLALEETLSQPSSQALLMQVDKECVKFVADTYMRLATGFMSGADRLEIMGKLREGGLLAVLSYNFDLTRAVAAIGLANTVSRSHSVVGMLLHILTIDLDTVLPQIREIQEKTGMELVVADDNWVIALV